MKSVALALLTLLASSTVFALSTDRDQELEVNAGRSVFNEDKEYYLLTDGFHLRQGSLKIDADRARIFGSFGKEFKRIIVEGKPARMQQMLDGEPGLFKARAEVIRYDLEKDIMVLTGHVVVTQHRGQMHSEKMVYDIVNGKVSAGSARGSSPGRVQMRIEPDTIKRKHKSDEGGR